MKTKAIRAYTPIVRLMSAMLALVLVIMAFPTTAFASYDYTAANTLTIPFIQLTSNELNTQQKFSSTLSYKSPNLGKVLAHVMDVVGDDGEFGVGFCGDHNLHLGNDNIGSDTWVYSGIWSPNGSRPFLDYYYAKNYESDLIRQECPGQTDGWYAQALNTEEWGYAMYVTPAQRYSLNTLVQIAIWLDRTGKLGDLPSAATFCSGWNAVKQTTWYKVLAKEMKSCYKALGVDSSAKAIDNMLYTLLSQYYAQDVPNQIQVFEYVHWANPSTVQPLLVMWHK